MDEQILMKLGDAADRSLLLLRVDQAAGLINLGRSKVYEMIASGELPSVRIGRAVRVPRSGLEAWVRRLTGAK